jgi:hypothetical protein
LEFWSSHGSFVHDDEDVQFDDLWLLQDIVAAELRGREIVKFDLVALIWCEVRISCSCALIVGTTAWDKEGHSGICMDDLAEEAIELLYTSYLLLPADAIYVLCTRVLVYSGFAQNHGLDNIKSHFL